MKHYQGVQFPDVHINEGFWHRRQKLNSEVTVYSVWQQFIKSGRFESFNFNWKPDMPNKPHFFWDSDIAKWIEGVAYILVNVKDEKLEKAVDEIVDLIEKHQLPNGYFNIFFTVIEPQNQFNKRTDHELYCAGHLMEAAVAYFESTGKDKFLKQMCRYADYIETAFVKEKFAAFTTCGHEEIELALVKLYKCTGEKRYLELSKYFVDKRGTYKNDVTYPIFNKKYAQDHLPVRQQTTAEGHAVRAVYLYCAMADLAAEYDDQELYETSRKLFENIASKKMYITGGIGSGALGEAFTIDYDLPNQTAYTESCAAIGLMLFAKRMLLLEADSLYSDVAERALYNGFLSSTSLDGKAFFYENPLEIDPSLRDKDTAVEIGKSRYPLMERVEVFECSCCPPNITRFVASLGDMLYTYNNSTLYVHHYMNSSTKFEHDDTTIHISQETKYPQDGRILITVTGQKDKKIAVRIPSWCSKHTLKLDGADATFEIIKGYAYIACTLDTTVLELNLMMETQLIEASPYVQENAGRVALVRGPIVYCLEGVDNGSYLRNISIDKNLSDLSIQYDPYFDAPVIKVKGTSKDLKQFSNLYQPLGDTCQDKLLTFIPYYTFGNRGASEMIIWILCQ